MLQVGEFSAWIKVENVETQEYNIEISDDGKNITCWIASEVGKVRRPFHQAHNIFAISQVHFSIFLFTGGTP